VAAVQHLAERLELPPLLGLKAQEEDEVRIVQCWTQHYPAPPVLFRRSGHDEKALPFLRKIWRLQTGP
jgi:hypothetical protein